MATEKIHLIVKHGCGGSVPTLWPHAVASDLLPHVCLEVVLIQIITIVSIVATKDVHVILIDNTRVRMPRTRTLLRVKWLKLLPRARLNAIAMEVINTVITIVASEYIDAPSMDYSCVSITRARWLRASI